MGTFVVSQSELWHRRYQIEAETLEEAKEKYKKYVDSGYDPDDDIIIDEPQFLDDIKEDVVWYDTEGVQLNA